MRSSRCALLRFCWRRASRNLNSDRGWASEKLRPQGNLADSFRLREQVWVDGAGERVESAKKGRCRRVEVFIADREDVAGPGSGSLLPTAIGDDPCQRNPVTSSAPGSNDHCGSAGFYFVCSDLLSGDANELAASRIHELCHPCL